MVSVTFNIPEEHLNKLNNFYYENFGYEIHTVLLNFISQELENCEGYSTEKKEYPVPTIPKHRGGEHIVVVTYPNGKSRSIIGGTYEQCITIMNEWSKHSYQPDKKKEVVDRIKPKKAHKVLPKSNDEHIGVRNGKYSVKVSHKGKRRAFGTYDTLEDAVLVRHFLSDHNGDKKYRLYNLQKEHPHLHQYNFSDYLLELAKEWYNETDNTNE